MFIVQTGNCSRKLRCSASTSSKVEKKKINTVFVNDVSVSDAPLETSVFLQRWTVKKQPEALKSSRFSLQKLHSLLWLRTSPWVWLRNICSSGAKSTICLLWTSVCSHLLQSLQLQLTSSLGSRSVVSTRAGIRRQQCRVSLQSWDVLQRLCQCWEKCFPER